MRIEIDGELLANVPPVLVNDYILEQCRLHAWRIVASGPDGSGGRCLDLLNSDGCMLTMTVSPL